MDILLHIAGLAFIPVMLYIVVSGIHDIIIMIREYHFEIYEQKRLTQKKSAIFLPRGPRIYSFHR